MTVPRRSRMRLGHVEGDLDVEHDAVVTPVEGDTIRVDGRVQAEGNVVFEGSLTATDVRADDGDLQVRGDLTVSGSVRVDEGSLQVSGSLMAEAVDVEKHLKVVRDVTVSQLDVGGQAEIRGTLNAKSVEIGGSLEVAGTGNIDEIDVGGSVHITGEVRGRNIDVGGSVKIGGGTVTEQIDVGGSFVSTAPLEFNEIDVGGVVKLGGNSSGRKLDVGGIAKVDGNLKFEEIDVGGIIEIRGNAEGRDVDVGGVLTVTGNLNMTGHFEVGGKCRVGGTLSALEIESGGRLDASDVRADMVEVGGSITTEKGVKAGSITIGERGRVRGPLIGDNIRVRERSEVEALYGRTIALEERSRAASISGVDIHVESHCTILGEVLYSGSLKADDRVHFTIEPRKVDSLPEPQSRG